MLQRRDKEVPLQHQPEDSDLLYKVSAIARFLGMTEKQARHRVERGEIPSFKLFGSRCARRSTLTAWLAEQEAKAQRAAA